MNGLLLKALRRFTWIFFAALLLSHCGLYLQFSQKGQKKEQPWQIFLYEHSESGSSPTVSASSQPALNIPPEAHLPADAFEVRADATPPPLTIDGTFVPVGRIYKVGLEGPMLDYPFSLRLPPGVQAELKYTYDRNSLKTAGLTEEFAVFYYDSYDKAYRYADGVSQNLEKGTVTASTSHFTSFVLTAIPPSNGNITPPPSCIAGDYPGGLSGSGGAALTVLDGGSRYLRDRNFTIVQDQNFDDLGFSGALAVATCNGDSACGDFSQHKLFTGSDYIAFTAHANIDVYLMYDARGGSDITDSSADAPWIAGKGFINTGRFITTTDPARRFRVYRKSYSRGSLVRLDGNRAGVTAPGIQSNYWLVIKRQDMQSAEPAARLCESAPVSITPGVVRNARGIPGADRAILLWQNPDDENAGPVTVRRSLIAPPSLETDGVSVVGSSLHAQGIRDDGLELNTTYFYTIFSHDKDGNLLGTATTVLTTGIDTDSDGISDAYEGSAIYASGLHSDSAKLDTDGDGISDGDEIAAGTDPTNADITPPSVAIALKSRTTTSDPVIRFSITGSDNTGITGWMITRSEEPPLAASTAWKTSPPDYFTVTGSGTYRFYAWARDAAGNVSSAASTDTVTLDGINVIRYVYATSGTNNTITSYGVDPATGQLSLIETKTAPPAPSSIVIDPVGHNLFVSGVTMGQVVTYTVIGGYGLAGIIENTTMEATSGSIVQYVLDPNTGGLSGVSSTTVHAPVYLALSPKVTHMAVLKAQAHFPDPASVCSYEFQLCRNYCSNCPNVNAFSDSSDCTSSWSSLAQCLQYNIPSGDKGVATYRLNGGGLNYVTTVATGALPYASAFHPTGDYLYVTNFTDTGIGVLAVDQSTGALTHKQTAGAPAGARGLAVSGDGRHLYVAGPSGVTGYQIDSLTGGLTQIGQWSTSAAVDVAASPDGRSIYVLSQTANRLYAFGRNPQDGSLLQLQSSATGSGPTHLAMDEEGRWLFTADSSGNTVSAFPLDFQSGLPGGKVTQPGPANPVGLAIYSTHDANDPPVANGGEDHWVQIGTDAALSGQASFDPDAARCGANTANYRYDWTMVSVPPGSNITTASISNRDTLRLASFHPDVTGDYLLQLSFKDDPGTCQGTAKTSLARIKISVGYYHTQNNTYYDTIGTLTVPDPKYDKKWNETQTIPDDWGITYGWALIYKENAIALNLCVTIVDAIADACEAASSGCLWAAPACWAGCEATRYAGEQSCKYSFRKYDYFHYCTSPFLQQPDGDHYCMAIDPASNLPPYPGWAQVVVGKATYFQLIERHWWHIGYWSWWTYS